MGISSNQPENGICFGGYRIAWAGLLTADVVP